MGRERRRYGGSVFHELQNHRASLAEIDLTSLCERFCGSEDGGKGTIVARKLGQNTRDWIRDQVVPDREILREKRGIKGNIPIIIEKTLQHKLFNKYVSKLITYLKKGSWERRVLTFYIKNLYPRLTLHCMLKNNLWNCSLKKCSLSLF